MSQNLPLLLPGDEGFYETLHSGLPPGALAQGNRYFAPDSNTGILKPLSDKELEEYMWGGECDEYDDIHLAFDN